MSCRARAKRMRVGWAPCGHFCFPQEGRTSEGGWQQEGRWESTESGPPSPPSSQRVEESVPGEAGTSGPRSPASPGSRPGPAAPGAAHPPRPGNRRPRVPPEAERPGAGAARSVLGSGAEPGLPCVAWRDRESQRQVGAQGLRPEAAAPGNTPQDPHRRVRRSRHQGDGTPVTPLSAEDSASQEVPGRLRRKPGLGRDSLVLA